MVLNIYLNFASFLNTELVKVIEITSSGRWEHAKLSQYHACRWPGDMSRQGISRHDIDKYSRPHTKRVNTDKNPRNVSWMQIYWTEKGHYDRIIGHSPHQKGNDLSTEFAYMQNANKRTSWSLTLLNMGIFFWIHHTRCKTFLNFSAWAHASLPEMFYKLLE